MADGRRAAAGGVLLLWFVAGAAAGQQREPSTGSEVAPGERRSASPEQQAIPAKVPPGSVEHGRYIVHNVAMCVEFHMTVQDAADVVAYLKSLP